MFFKKKKTQCQRDIVASIHGTSPKLMFYKAKTHLNIFKYPYVRKLPYSDGKMTTDKKHFNHLY